MIKVERSQPVPASLAEEAKKNNGEYNKPEEDDKARVEFFPKLNCIVYTGGKSSNLVHNLSAGYQSVLCLVMELAYRTALLNPNLGSSERLRGVVMIDKIDMHFHPRWQWKCKQRSRKCETVQ